MPVGTVTYQKQLYAAVKLLENQEAANGVPTLDTHGADITGLFPTRPNASGTIVIKGTGTGAIVGTFRLWGYCPELGDWLPLGTGTDADKGKLNAGTEIGEVRSDVLLHAEAAEFAGHFTRLYLQLIGPGGTTPSFNAYFIAPRIVTY